MPSRANPLLEVTCPYLVWQYKLEEQIYGAVACSCRDHTPRSEGLSMTTSSFDISFTRNDLSRTRLEQKRCPVKGCSVDISKYEVPYQKRKGKMRYMPFCPEHGLRLHRSSGYVYYNGPSDEQKMLATRRNLMFNADYFLGNYFGAINKDKKMESARLCYESSEDAVTYNIFTELLKHGVLPKVVSIISEKPIQEEVELYLWGSKIDFKTQAKQYQHLISVRDKLESDIHRFQTEPDIMLIVPQKILICIEAKFASDHSLAKEKDVQPGEKPKKLSALIDRYCTKNKCIIADDIFDLGELKKNNEITSGQIVKPFYDQLFRNMVFAASMSELAGIKDWYVASLRTRHVKYTKGSRPVLKAVKAILQKQYKNRFTDIEWEDIYAKIVTEDLTDNKMLGRLAWYMETKSLGCGRAFNCFRHKRVRA